MTVSAEDKALQDLIDRREARRRRRLNDVSTLGTSTLDTADDYLSNVTEDSPEQSSTLSRLQGRASSLNAADLKRIQIEDQKEIDKQQSIIDQQEKERLAGVARVRQNIRDTADTARSSVNPMIDRLGSLPTVGGIGLLVGIIVLLLFTVVVVNSNGDTRLKQFWYMLNGRATIEGRQAIIGASAGTDFGSTPKTGSQVAVTTTSTQGNTLRDTSGLGF
jgi:hypothetical protein